MSNNYEQLGQPGSDGRYTNPHGQQGNAYGQQGNPYAQQSQSYGGGYQNQSYTDRPDPHQDTGYYGAQGGYEMGGMGTQDRILNECRAIDAAIDAIETDVQRLKSIQQRYLNDTDTSANSALGREVDRLNEDIMAKYRALVSRVKKIKQDPESGSPRNSAQVGKVDRRVREAMQTYQVAEREYRKSNEEQIARQYRIVRPDASEAEVREAVQNPSQQVFSDALINSNRRGEAQRVADNVRGRHAAIQKIEQDMIALAQLFHDLEAMVVLDQPKVQRIEHHGEEINENVAKANTEIEGAVVKARAARRKKWMCLWIGLAILVIIGIAVGLGVYFSTRGNP